MSSKLYKYIPISQRNDTNPFCVIFKIPQKNEIDFFYTKVMDSLSKSYEAPYFQGDLTSQSKLVLKTISICLPAIVNWENINEDNGSPILIETYKSNRISLKAFERIPSEMRQEISSVLEALVLNGEDKSLINKNEIKIFKVDADLPIFTLDDKEIENFIESTIKKTIFDKNKAPVNMNKALQKIEDVKKREEIFNKDVKNMEKAFQETINVNKRFNQLLKVSALDRYNPVQGGETVFYYIRLRFKEKKYYKVGVTLRDVESRYTKKDLQFIEKILYEKKLTHANTIEQKILKDYKNHIFPLAILSSGHSEVFDYDVLGLDV